jgi:diguanylate cyclase (GGDEF)-like protein/PAS domain S-box-containing protein
MKTLSIRTKLTVHTLISVLVALLLVGVSVNYVLRDLLRETAVEELDQELEVFLTRLEDSKARLIEESDAIVSNKIIVAALNLIDRYEQAEDYSSILFDEEKKKIFKRLIQIVPTGEPNEIFIYDNQCRIISFVSDMAAGFDGGISTYRQGEFLFSLHRPAGGWEVAPLPQSLKQHQHCPVDHQAREPHYHFADHGLLIAYDRQIIRHLPSDKQRNIGSVSLSWRIDDAFIASVNRQSIVNFSLENPPSPSDAANSEHVFHRTHVLSAHPNTQIQLRAAYPQELFHTAAQSTLNTVLVVMLVSALVVIPLSLLFSRKTISAPLGNLLSGVAAFRKGRYETSIPIESDDEIGALASAMNLMGRDIQDREENLSAIIANIPQMIFVKDAATLRFIKVNTSFEDLTGLSRDTVIGKSDYDFFPESQADFFTGKDRETLANGKVLDIAEEPLDSPSGQRILHTRKVPIYDRNAKPRYLLGVSEDITERKRVESRLRQWAAVFQNTTEGVIITDQEARILTVNKAFTDITGYLEQEVVGNNPRLLKSGKHEADFYRTMWQSLLDTGHWRGEICNRKKNGDFLPVWQTISSIKDENGELTNFVSVFSDISSVKKAQEKLDYLAYHDPLTDLPNRLLLNDRLQHAISLAQREQSSLAVMFLDLDRFKNINDSMGHPVGDTLLENVAQRLQISLRATDTVARQGGDEFIVLLEDVGTPDNAARMAKKLIDTFQQPFHILQRDIFITPSIGITLFPDDGDNATTLIRNADAAMYRAKDSGRNQYWFYTEDMTIAANLKVETEQALRHALSRTELVLHFQPQYDTQRNRVIGAEALVRWQRNGELVPPGLFIPLAEETGLIHEIGEWVTHSACRQFMAWQQAGLGIERISVNVSTLQVVRGDLLDVVEHALKTSGMAAKHLELEITEAVFLQSEETTGSLMDEINALGVHLALDDFGTGFSSLSYLKNYPFHRLKIDQSFVRDMLDNSNNRAIVEAIVAMGKGLGLDIIAEGVETEAQLKHLKSIGCPEIQGYFIGKPMAAAHFVKWMKERNPVA